MKRLLCIVCLGVALCPAPLVYTFAFAATGPSITTLSSPTHPDENIWYSNNKPSFSWHENLTQIGAYDTPGNATDLDISGNYAFVADYRNGLEIIDVFDPTTPVQKGFLSLGYALYVSVSGSYAYVTTSYSLNIVNISNPAAPVLTGTFEMLELGWSPEDVSVSGNYAYVANRGAGLRIIDISNPAAPELKGTCDTPGTATGVYVSGNYAYVADLGSGLQIIDISNPAAPFLKGSFSSITDSYNVKVAGNYAYVADGADGLQIIDISNPAAPTLKGTYDTPGDAQGVDIAGNFAFVADGYGGLVWLDISNPTAPVLEGSLDTPDAVLGVSVMDGNVYVAAIESYLLITQFRYPAYSCSYDTYPASTPDTVADSFCAEATRTMNSSPDGIRYFHVRAMDYYGNWGTAAHRKVMIDTTAPTTTDNAPADWQQADFTVNLSCSDASSGCAETHYRVDGGADTVGTSVTISTNGDHTITYHSVDNAGNVEADKTVYAKLDQTAPGISNITPAGTVYGSLQTIGADLTDSGGSGINSATATIAVDGGSALGKCNRTADHISCQIGGLAAGAHTINVSVADNAGNTKTAVGSFSVVIIDTDTTPPVTTDNAPAFWKMTNFNVTLYCTDAGSGCKESHYKIDGGIYTVGDTVAISTEGDHLITYYSVDNAGNTETEKTVHAKLDKTVPVTTDNAPATWQNADFNVALSCTDAGGSSCQETRYEVTGGVNDTVGNIVAINTNGDHLITYYSLDNAGNTETSKTTHAKLDKAAPVISNIKPTGTVDSANQTIEADLSDSGGSGINSSSASISMDSTALTDCTISSTHISCPATVSPGPHVIDVSVSDNAGNIKISASNFTYTKLNNQLCFPVRSQQGNVLLICL